MAIFGLFVFKNVFTLLKTYIPFQYQLFRYKCFHFMGGMVFFLTPYPLKNKLFAYNLMRSLNKKCFQKCENKSENILVFGVWE